MIYNKQLTELVLKENTRERALEVSNMLKDFFVIAIDHKEDKAIIKQKTDEIILALEGLNTLAEAEGMSHVYVEEGSQGEDIRQYLLSEFKSDVYGKKL